MKNVLKTAYVIGNGSSREKFKLQDLKGRGKVFGCNALYREYKDHILPDYLVAIDTAIIKENPARPRSNAGMNAIKEAIKKGYTSVYIFGFDFLVVNEKIAISNVFHGTECYGLDTRANLNDTRNRMNYLGWMIEQNPDVKFHFCYPENVIESGIYAPDVVNVSILNFDDLNSLLLEQ